MKKIIHNFQNKTHFDTFVEKLRKIAVKDPTFMFCANEEKLEVYIYSNNEDILHKRCLWLINKADNTGRLVYRDG